jgi:putative glycosyltransferase
LTVELSIVTTLYHSAPYVEEFHKRISETLEKTDYVAEIIFVNDGSPDNAVELCRKLIKKDNRVIVIDLSRNFGHHKALYAGIAQARGHRIFLIDCDLEEDPELLTSFYENISRYVHRFFNCHDQFCA